MRCGVFETGASEFFGQRFLVRQEIKQGNDENPDKRGERTAARMQQHAVVLCIADTTELDFNGWIARLMRLGRTCPDLEASLFFDADEIRGAYLLAKKARPASPPTLNQMIRLIASLGGFLGRKGDGEPGAKTLWIGLQRTVDAASTIQALRMEDA